MTSSETAQILESFWCLFDKLNTPVITSRHCKPNKITISLIPSSEPLTDQMLNFPNQHLQDHFQSSQNQIMNNRAIKQELFVKNDENPLSQPDCKDFKIMGTKERLGCFFKQYLAEYSDPSKPKIRDLIRKRGYQEFANRTSKNANEPNGMKKKIKWGEQSNSSGRRLYIYWEIGCWLLFGDIRSFTFVVKGWFSQGIWGLNWEGFGYWFGERIFELGREYWFLKGENDELLIINNDNNNYYY